MGIPSGYSTRIWYPRLTSQICFHTSAGSCTLVQVPRKRMKQKRIQMLQVYLTVVFVQDCCTILPVVSSTNLGKSIKRCYRHIYFTIVCPRLGTAEISECATINQSIVQYCTVPPLRRNTRSTLIVFHTNEGTTGVCYSWSTAAIASHSDPFQAPLYSC